MTGIPSLAPWIWLGCILLPLAMGVLLGVPRWRRLVMRLSPAAALPAVWLALTARTGAVVDLPWLLTGLRFGIDPTGRIFLLFTSVLYLVAGIDALFVLRHKGVGYRFFACYLFAMGGNIGLILAQDVVGFYTLFALMSFSAFGLVAHSHSQRARHAGRIYIVMVMLSEVLVFAALAIAASEGSRFLSDLPAQVLASPWRNAIVTLLVLGFGIKVGMFPLHVWLPVSYRSAPIPAAALLSACMSKAGILGWFRCLPLQGPALPGWAAVLLVAGFFTTIYALVVGFHQADPKSVLAYSSMSKMGLLVALVGVALAGPGLQPAVWGAMIATVLHHATAKTALFLGVGVSHVLPHRPAGRLLFWAGLGVPMVSLVGLPFTAGWVAKAAMKGAVHEAPMRLLDGFVAWFLPCTAVMTVLLMARFVLLTWRTSLPADEGTRTSGHFVPWLASVLLVLALPGILAAASVGVPLHTPAFGRIVWSGTWPAVAGLVLVWVGWRSGWKLRSIPCGDLLAGFERLGKTLSTALPPGLRTWIGREQSAALGVWTRVQETARHPHAGSLVEKGESRLYRWPALGYGLLLCGATVFLALLFT